MRVGLTSRLLSALASVLLLAACSGSTNRDTADDAALHHDITSGQAGVEVTFDGTLAADPVQVGTHEHLQVKTPTGDFLEVDHNTDLAPSVPAHAGDTVVERDGTFAGPDLESLRQTVASTGHKVIYAGGIASLDDVRAVARAGASGVIIGKAIYEGRVDLAAALSTG